MTSLPDAAPATPTPTSSNSSGRRNGDAGDVDITKPLLIEETVPGNTTTKPAPIIVQDTPSLDSTNTTTTTTTKNSITMGTFTFCPLEGFYDAIKDARFDQDRFLDVLTTIIGCDLVYSDELQECCVDQCLPSLALAAATCPYVLGSSSTNSSSGSGEPYIEIALGLVGDVEHCRSHAHKTRLYTTLINPVPAAILVAAVQPDVDPELFWQQLELRYFDNGEQPLNEQQVLQILTSDAVKLSHRPLWKRVGDFFTASLF